MSAVARNTAGLSRLVWTAGIVVGACLPHVTTLPLWMPALLGVCVGWRFGARLAGWPLPGRWTMRAITVAGFAGVLLEFRTINGLLPGTALLFVMAALKFLEAKSQRDHIMLTVLAYFIVFASVLAGGGLIKGLYLLAFVWITTLGLLQVGRRGPLLASLPTARMAGRLLLQSMPLMIVLFLLFPRLPGPLWSMPGQSSAGSTGLAGTMSPGDITNLGMSDEVAFRVDFETNPPAAADLYWRGPVLSTFDGRTWSRLDGMRGGVGDTVETLGEATRYRVMLEPGSPGWAFALEMAATFSTDDRRRSIRMGDDYQLWIGPQETLGTRVNYTVTSYPRFRAMESLTEREREVFTRLPPDANPRTRALVDGWLADSPGADTIIARGLEVFAAEGFFYTLTPPPLGEHTADEFIFETREGFCEHYASAFAIMMRMAGLPARVVTGYQGGELNGIGEYYIVRQSNAHAWTEVWTPENGWTRVDPISAVAPERIALGFGGPLLAESRTIAQRIGRIALLRQAALAWDAASTFWNDWVIGYGPALQRSLLESFGFDRPRWRELLWLTIGATTLMMVAMAAWFGFSGSHWRARDRAAAAFLRFERRLRRARIAPMRAGETPSAYAARAAAALPGCRDAILGITQSYLAARYEPDSNGAALASLRARVSAFRPSSAHASR